MRKRNSLIILLVFIFLSLVFFWRYFLKGQVPLPANLLVAAYGPWQHYLWEGYPNGPPNKPIGFDVIRLFYPHRKFTIDQLKSGQWPLWNPYNFSGNVHLATYQAAVFYPLNFVYFILPLVDAWSTLVILQPILAGFFMYLFLKEINLSKKASFFGSLSFAFSGWMLAWSEESLVIEHSALWLPLILYSIEKIIKKISAKNIALLVFASTSSILAGFLQLSIYVFATVLAWLIFRFQRTKLKDSKRLRVLGVAFFLSFLIASPQILPAVESYFTAARNVVESRFLFEDYLFKPQHLITFLAPDFWGNPGVYNYFGSGFYHEKVIYIGIPALLFSLLAFFANPARRSLVFFQRFSFIVLLLALDPFGWSLYWPHFPLISTMIPARIAFLITFGFCTLAAFGVDLFFQQKTRWRDWRGVLIGISLVFLGFGWFVRNRIVVFHDKNALISLRNLILPTGFFLASAMMILGSLFKQKLKLLSFLGLVFLSLASSFYFANKFLYFSERKFVFPEVSVITKLKEIAGIDRAWGYGNAYLERNMNVYYGLYSPEGYEALFSLKYGKLLFASETEGKITDQISRVDAVIKQASEREGVLDSWPRERLLALLGVKYIMEAKMGEGKEWKTTEERFPQAFFNLAWEDEKFRIWDYQEALPRAFLVDDYLVETDEQKIADYLFDENFNLRKKIILEEEPSLIIWPCESVGTAEIIKYTPNKIEIKTNSSCPGLLFLSDSYYPGWKAKVNDQSAKIYRANFAFRAVAVPAGEQQVIFSYQPKIFYWSLRLSLLALVFLIGWLIYLKL